MPKPLLAITQGDPSGIGPETIVGAWTQPAMHETCRAVVVGHPGILQRAVNLLRTRARIWFVDASDKSEELDKLVSSPEVIPCLPVGSDDALETPPATIDRRGACRLRGEGRTTPLLDRTNYWGEPHLSPDGQHRGHASPQQLRATSTRKQVSLIFLMLLAMTISHEAGHGFGLTAWHQDGYLPRRVSRRS
jgi:hypothetical protein